jgi:hypothetical protein
MNIAVMKQALDFCQYAWQTIHMDEYAFEQLEKTIAALEAELAKPEQPDLRKAADMALDALERGTTGLAIRAIPALRQALAQLEFDTPESHVVKWSIPVDPNNFGEALAQPEHPLDKKADNARELGLDYEPDHGFDRTASHMAGEYVSTNQQNVNTSEERVHKSGECVHEPVEAD